MKNNLSIRIATHKDVDDVYKITKEAFSNYVKLANISSNIAALTETREDITKDIDNKLVLIADEKNVPVGSLRVQFFEDNTAYLSRFGVISSSQNNGIGKALLHAVDLYNKERKVTKISLHTCSKVSSLITFYYNSGYFIEEVNTDKGYLRATLTKEYK